MKTGKLCSYVTDAEPKAEGFPSSSTLELDLHIKWVMKSIYRHFPVPAEVESALRSSLDFTFGTLTTQPLQPSTILDSFSRLLIPSPCRLPSPSVRNFFSVPRFLAFQRHHPSWVPVLVVQGRPRGFLASFHSQLKHKW